MEIIPVLTKIIDSLSTSELLTVIGVIGMVVYYTVPILLKFYSLSKNHVAPTIDKNQAPAKTDGIEHIINGVIKINENINNVLSEVSSVKDFIKHVNYELTLLDEKINKLKNDHEAFANTINTTVINKNDFDILKDRLEEVQRSIKNISKDDTLEDKLKETTSDIKNQIKDLSNQVQLISRDLLIIQTSLGNSMANRSGLNSYK